jgi:hypothetical protein
MLFGFGEGDFFGDMLSHVGDCLAIYVKISIL